jgi:hypothetical protein
MSIYKQIEIQITLIQEVYVRANVQGILNTGTFPFYVFSSCLVGLFLPLMASFFRLFNVSI